MVSLLSGLTNYCEISKKTIKKSIFRQGGFNVFGQELSWANKKGNRSFDQTPFCHPLFD